MATKNRTAYLAIIDGTVWVRGSTAAKPFLSAGEGRYGMGWSSKAPTGNMRTAVPIESDGILEKALRAAIKARQIAAEEARKAKVEAAGRPYHRYGPSASPSDAWVKQEDLDQRTKDLIDAALHRHAHR